MKKNDLKNAAHVDTSRFARKKSLASLAPVPVNLSKLSDAVKNYVTKFFTEN